MIKLIFDIIGSQDFYGLSKDMDIAQGLYSIPKTNKEAVKKLKRVLKSKR